MSIHRLELEVQKWQSYCHTKRESFKYYSCVACKKNIASGIVLGIVLEYGFYFLYLMDSIAITTLETTLVGNYLIKQPIKQSVFAIIVITCFFAGCRH